MSDLIHSDNGKLDKPQRARRLRKGFVRLAMWLAGLTLLFIMASILLSHVSLTKLNSFHQSIRDLDRSIFQWLRLAFIVVVAAYWKPVNTWLAKRNAWSDVKLNITLAYRWRILGVLIFIELFFIRRIHQYAIAFLSE